MKPKEIEDKAIKALGRYVEETMPGWTMKKATAPNNIGDVILEGEKTVLHVEIKSSAKELDSNIRFSHQTIAKAQGKRLVVAMISHVKTKNPQFAFFELSSVMKDMLVEPTFIIKKTKARQKQTSLPDLVATHETPRCNFDALLTSTVGEHMKSIAVQKLQRG